MSNGFRAKMKEFLFAKQGRIGLALLVFVCFLTSFHLFSIPSMAVGKYKPLVAKIPVYAENVSANPSTSYRITIEKTDSGVPSPDTDYIILKSNTNGTFQVEVTEPGTYRYKIYQTKGSEAYVEYDKKVYDVYLCVINDEKGELTCTVSATLEGSAIKPDKIAFANRWTKTDPAPVTPPEADSEKEKSAAVSDIISFKTGEYRMVRVTVYAGIMLMIGIGAFVYVCIKRSDDNKTNKNAENE